MNKINKIEKDNKFIFVYTKKLFLLINIVVILGYIISYLIGNKLNEGKNDTGVSTMVLYIPIYICNIISIISLGIIFYFEQKDIKLIAMTTPKKYINIYITSYIMHVFLIIITLSLLMILNSTVMQVITTKWCYIITIISGAILSIIEITLYKYSIFKIEITQYIRRYKEEKENKK